MGNHLWEKIRLAIPAEDRLWEVFHENSKVGRCSPSRADAEVLQWMQSLHECLPFEGYPVVELPQSPPSIQMCLSEAITTRRTERALQPSGLMLEQLATILYHAYGITKTNDEADFPRPFRTVPSAGALYPLELFFYTSRTKGLIGGLYHYNPSQNCVRLLREGGHAQQIADALVQPAIGRDASAIVFITAIFERTTFKYEERGYRFVLLEAGHVAQNINLCSNALGLACINIGGFFDREIDNFLEIDGVTHSTVYVIAIGGRQ